MLSYAGHLRLNYNCGTGLITKVGLFACVENAVGVNITLAINNSYA